MRAVALMAIETGEPLPALSFRRSNGREYLRMEVRGEMFFYNGESVWPVDEGPGGMGLDRGVNYADAAEEEEDDLTFSNDGPF